MTPPPDSRYESRDALLRRLEQTERELAVMRDQVEHSHRLAMLGMLSAGVIHEINNILTPVLAYAQMAGSNPRDAELLAKAAQKTTRGVSQASDIAESMLLLAQPGRADAEPNCALVSAACQSALSCLGRDPEKDGISVTIEIPEDLTCAIRPLALQQVILNLLINAVEALKSMPTKDRRLTIRAWQHDIQTHTDHMAGAPQPSSDRHTVRIEVADTGPGIPESIRSKLFMPFVSARPKRNTASTSSSGITSGSGLGLSVCRTLIESAGGTIAAESSRDTGTVFTIDLPHDRAQSQKLAG